MSTLAIDAGNTRIKWGVHDGSNWLQQGAMSTADAERLRDDFAQWPSTERVIVANVAGERVAKALTQALEPVEAKPLWVVSRSQQCGVRSGYAEPARLGADRWAALIATRYLYEGPCVVVNAGTTMTVDALSSESIFLGGFIVPGFALMRGVLATHTAQLAVREGTFSFFPDNTGDAIASGALNALAGAVERMCRYLVETGEDEPTVVLSGGNAGLLAPRLNGPLQVVGNLVLEGLVRIGASDV